MNEKDDLDRRQTWNNDVNGLFFKEQFASSFDAMMGALDRTVDALRKNGWITEKEEPCTRLCLEESLVNAIRHGNQCDMHRSVMIELHDQYPQCLIRIYDEGKGFYPETIAMPAPEQLGGRGVCLMRHYMEKVSYNQEKRCLEMVFRRRNTGTGEND